MCVRQAQVLDVTGASKPLSPLRTSDWGFRFLTSEYTSSLSVCVCVDVGVGVGVAGFSLAVCWSPWPHVYLCRGWRGLSGFQKRKKKHLQLRFVVRLGVLIFFFRLLFFASNRSMEAFWSFRFPYAGALCTTCWMLYSARMACTLRSRLRCCCYCCRRCYVCDLFCGEHVEGDLEREWLTYGREVIHETRYDFLLFVAYFYDVQSMRRWKSTYTWGGRSVCACRWSYSIARTALTSAVLLFYSTRPGNRE